jgi:hypothetical protein
VLPSGSVEASESTEPAQTHAQSAPALAQRMEGSRATGNLGDIAIQRAGSLLAAALTVPGALRGQPSGTLGTAAPSGGIAELRVESVRRENTDSGCLSGRDSSASSVGVSIAHGRRVASSGSLGSGHIDG